MGAGRGVDAEPRSIDVVIFSSVTDESEGGDNLRLVSSGSSSLNAEHVTRSSFNDVIKSEVLLLNE